MSFHKHAFAKKLLTKSTLKKLSIFGITSFISVLSIGLLQANSEQQGQAHLVSIHETTKPLKAASNHFVPKSSSTKSSFKSATTNPMSSDSAVVSAWQFRNSVPITDIPDQAIPNSAHYIDMDIEVLSNEELSMTLPNGQTISLQQSGTEDYASGSSSWIGTDPTNEELFASITQYKDSVAGEIHTEDGTFEINTLKNGKSIIYKVDSKKLDNLSQADDAVRFLQSSNYSSPQNIQSSAEQNFSKPESLADTALPQSTSSTAPTTSGDINTITEIDVLYVYTKASIAKFGMNNLIASVENAVSIGNSGAYPNSKMRVRLKPVAHLAYNFADTSTLLMDLQTNKYMNLEYYRNKYGADLVQGITYSYSYCGMGYQMSGNYSLPFGRHAYSIVKQSCIGYSMLHELGHNMGMDHNLEDSGTYSPTPAKGLRYCSSTGFRTLMSYDCLSVSVPRISRFSNPNAYYNGLPTGKIGVANNAGIVDGTTRFKVERFRLKKG